MSDFSTPSWESLNRSTLKKAGSDEWNGPCPVTNHGRNCFHVKIAARLIGCRSCGDGSGKLDPQQFKEHLEALGAEFGASDVIRPYDWVDYSTGEPVIQTRHLGEPKYLWPKGIKKGSLVYPARYDRDATRPIVWTEGAKAADAAASKLPADDYDVIGFPDSSTFPNGAILAEIAKGRPCIVWPDDDPPGAKVAPRLVSALRLVAADVVTIDPELLGLTGGHGHDAAEWHPRDSPGEELRAACVAAKPEEASPALMDRSEQIRLWVEELTNEDIEGQSLILCRIAKSPEWAALVPYMRLAFFGGLSKWRMVTSMATAILGRFDDRTGAWRDPPGGTVDTGVEHFRSIWTYAAEATPVVLVPGLAWRGRVSKISAAPKLGKTSLITNGIAAWQAGQTFLGSPTGPPGSVLYVSETGPAVLRAWFEQYGCPTDAPIIVGGAAAVDTIAKSAREHKPDLVVIDSLTDLHAASDGGNLWNAGDVRKLLQPLRELECAVILMLHDNQPYPPSVTATALAENWTTPALMCALTRVCPRHQRARGERSLR